MSPQRGQLSTKSFFKKVNERSPSFLLKTNKFSWINHSIKAKSTPNKEVTNCMFHYTVDTNKSVDEAVKALEVKLKEDQFGVLWDFDIKNTLEKKGLGYDRNYRVLEVCNPKAAKEVLEKNHMIGYFLPCKIVVYEDEGKTKIGMAKPTVLIELAGDETLTSLAKEIEDRLKACMDKSR